MRRTSLEAWRSILEGLPELRSKVMEKIILCGESGATCDEIEVMMGGRHQTISARVNELWNSGLIYDSGKRRATRSGRSAIVWQCC